MAVSLYKLKCTFDFDLDSNFDSILTNQERKNFIQMQDYLNKSITYLKLIEDNALPNVLSDGQEEFLLKSRKLLQLLEYILEQSRDIQNLALEGYDLDKLAETYEEWGKKGISDLDAKSKFQQDEEENMQEED